MRESQIKCEVCGSRVKGSFQFIPFLKEQLGWAVYEKDKETRVICPKHKKSQKFQQYFVKAQ